MFFFFYITHKTSFDSVHEHESVWFCGSTCFSPNFKFFFVAKIECGLYLLDRFDVLMSKMIFKKIKNIISMYFDTKNYLKSNHYHTVKHHRRINYIFQMNSSSPKQKYLKKY
jgi:hypothetical protein